MASISRKIAAQMPAPAIKPAKPIPVRETAEYKQKMARFSAGQNSIADNRRAIALKNFEKNQAAFENSAVMKAFQANPNQQTGEAVRASKEFTDYQTQQKAVDSRYRGALSEKDFQARERAINARQDAANAARRQPPPVSGLQQTSATPTPGMQSNASAPQTASPVAVGTKATPAEVMGLQQPVAQVMPGQIKKGSTGLPTGPSNNAQVEAYSRRNTAMAEKQSATPPQPPQAPPDTAMPAVMAKGGMVKPAAKKMAKGGVVIKANCGASVPPTQKYKK